MVSNTGEVTGPGPLTSPHLALQACLPLGGMLPQAPPGASLRAGTGDVFPITLFTVASRNASPDTTSHLFFLMGCDLVVCP